MPTTTTTTITSPIDERAVDRWLAGHVPGAQPPFRYTLIAGGRSNLTFEARAADGRRLVLRRPPLGQVLQSAHDVLREHRIVSALASTPVPVAPALAGCDDLAVTGAPFCVMEFVEGAVLREVEDAERQYDEAHRARIGEALVDVLADLHAVDPDAVGLGSLGRREAYVERQLRRWHAQFEGSKDQDVPAVDEAHRRLAERVPVQRRTTLVHGDFRIDNCLLGHDGGVRAVLDWELCTLGDPLADVGLLLMYWVDPGEDTATVLTGTATAAPGFPDRAALAARYAERSGADISDLDYYVALASWKLACVFDGIRARYAAGVMGDKDVLSVDTCRAQVQHLAQAALTHLERHP